MEAFFKLESEVDRLRKELAAFVGAAGKPSAEHKQPPKPETVHSAEGKNTEEETDPLTKLAVAAEPGLVGQRPRDEQAASTTREVKEHEELEKRLKVEEKRQELEPTAVNKQAVEIKSGENIEGKSGHLTKLADAAEPWLVGHRPRHHDEIELEWYREQFTDLNMTMDGLDDFDLDLAVQAKHMLRLNRWPDAEYVWGDWPHQAAVVPAEVQRTDHHGPLQFLQGQGGSCHPQALGHRRSGAWGGDQAEQGKEEEAMMIGERANYIGDGGLHRR